MHRITSATVAGLFDIAATRRIEQAAAAALPAHTLMQRAGLAVARLAMAIAPHARTIWIACGPGNNGGDGLEAAAQLQHRGFMPIVTFLGDENRLPPDAKASLQRARDASVIFAQKPPAEYELAIDALLGIGSTRPPEGVIAEWLREMDAGGQPVLSVDVPSGLNADTGVLSGSTGAHADTTRFCLTFLTLKPGLFTAHGRDAAGTVWFDDLGCGDTAEPPTARLAGTPKAQVRPHTSHKGSYGDVAVIGGASGMAGAALLAGSAALHAGAGRVFVGLLDPSAAPVDTAQPELMLRDANELDLSDMTAVCGCGGGTDVRPVLPRVLATAAALVLDADALNAIATDSALQTQLASRARRGRPTVITPHPLEAARLLGCTVGDVQADRLAAARQLASRFGVVAVLKGSGTAIADDDDGAPAVLNLTGNARLATAGTGDVLAGMIAAALAAQQPAFEAACEAVWRHGHIADAWPTNAAPLTAGTLARQAPF